MTVTIVSTGLANVASVRAAWERAGIDTTSTDDPATVARAERVVLPGVGAFGPGMQRLRSLGLDDALRDRVAADRPTLGICLGFQLLADESEEAPGVAGLGVIAASVRRFDEALRVPHMGWTPVAGVPGLADGVYFAHSYYVDDVPSDWDVVTAEHGVSFVAACERGATLLCQFHPELSGIAGAALLASWFEGRRVLS